MRIKNYRIIIIITLLLLLLLDRRMIFPNLDDLLLLSINVVLFTKWQMLHFNHTGKIVVDFLLVTIEFVC